VTATLLAIPDDPRFAELVAEWGDRPFVPGDGQRGRWLKAFEDLLRPYYPQASSRDRSLTARHHAPFWLALGPDVP